MGQSGRATGTTFFRGTDIHSPQGIIGRRHRRLVAKPHSTSMRAVHRMPALQADIST